MTTTTRGPLSGELAVIPRWAIVLAILVFVAVEILFLFLFGAFERNPPMLPFQLVFGAFMGSLLALWTLAVGYVNCDAGRRGASRTLWTLLVIFIPNAIGFILYFLLRPPIRAGCPGCGAPIGSGARYCPKCGRALARLCSGCGQPVGSGDAFCSSCGHALAA